MAKLVKVTKGIAAAISDEMGDAKFGERKKKYQNDIDDYVSELIQKHIPVELRKALLRYRDFIKTMPLVQVRDAARPKSSTKTIMTGEFFPYYLPIKIDEDEYKKLIAMDQERWDYHTKAERYKEELESLINKLETPEAIIQAIPESKKYVESYYPSTANMLESLDELAKQA